MCCGTFEERTALPDGNGTCSSILAQAELHEEERHSSEEKHDEVRDEKHTCNPTQDNSQFLFHKLLTAQTVEHGASNAKVIGSIPGKVEN